MTPTRAFTLKVFTLMLINISIVFQWKEEHNIGRSQMVSSVQATKLLQAALVSKTSRTMYHTLLTS
jgi:hypothetical protein